MEEVIENYFIWKTDLKNLEKLITPFSASSVQSELIQRTIGSDLNYKFPVFSEFNLRFCKHIIRLVENCSSEVLDELYELMQQILLNPEKSTFFKTYFIGSQTISLQEKAEIIRCLFKKKN